MLALKNSSITVAKHKHFRVLRIQPWACAVALRFAFACDIRTQ